MIFNELFGQHLRLGNFAYRLAWAVAYKKKHNIDSVYPEYYLWKYLKNPPIISNEIPSNMPIIRPMSWNWSMEEELYLDSLAEEFRTSDMQIALNHFMQSYMWFREAEPEVQKFFEIKDDYVECIRDKYSEVLKKPLIVIGLRLGDFSGHQSFYQIPYDFYLKAIQENIPDYENYNILILSDDIDHAKRIFQNVYFAEANNTATHAENFKYYHSEKAIEQFVLGTLATHFILGNSTFSWWQAYLSTARSGGKVIHSGKVFDNDYARFDTTYYYYPSWIHCDYESIELKPEMKKFLVPTLHV